MAREDGFFDDLARGLADGSITRGKALRLMGAALVGGTLAALGIGGVAAADPPGCKRAGKACKKDTQCCSGNCEGRTCGCSPADAARCAANPDPGFQACCPTSNGFACYPVGTVCRPV